MHTTANGIRLWFDAEGPALVPAPVEMVSRPTLILVHGGPGGYDHSYLKPYFAHLADVAQVVYLDLRGHGRSEWGNPDEWSYEQCADDLRAFCDELGIAGPIVLGHSMGGTVVLLYGARHPGHARGLILQSAMGRFDLERLAEGFGRVAGDEIAALAAETYGGTRELSMDEWRQVFAAFGPNVPDDEELARRIQNPDLAARGGEILRSTDYLSELGLVTSPTMVCVGDLDPVTPVESSREILSALSDGVGHLELLEGAGHFPWKDTPERYRAVLVEFIGRVTPGP